MDRLIVGDGQGGWHLDRVQWNRLRSGNIITPDIYGMLFNGLLRLKEYEDTGFTPEEIMDGKMRTGWIPVEERMPDPGTDVLTCIKRNDIEDGWQACHVYKYAGHWIGLANICKVIAWMPLPDPYKPEEAQP